jgi:hypothetical protein
VFGPIHLVHDRRHNGPGVLLWLLVLILIRPPYRTHSYLSSYTVVPVHPHNSFKNDLGVLAAQLYALTYWLINYVDTKAKCRQLKQFTCPCSYPSIQPPTLQPQTLWICNQHPWENRRLCNHRHRWIGFLYVRQISSMAEILGGRMWQSSFAFRTWNMDDGLYTYSPSTSRFESIWEYKQ